METEDTGVQPTPEEARTALAAARAEENATVNPPVSVWHYPVVAGALFALSALGAVDARTTGIRVLTIVLMLVLGVGSVWLVGKISLNRPGYRGIRTPWGPTILWMLVAAAFPITAMVLDDVIGSWVWIASGVGLAALVLIQWVAYQRKHRHG